jgi:hypothetical protein
MSKLRKILHTIRAKQDVDGNKERVRAIISQDKLDAADLPYLYDIFLLEGCEDLKFFTFFTIRHNLNLLNTELFAETLRELFCDSVHFSPLLIKQIFTKKMKQVKFPIVGENVTAIATICVVELSKPVQDPIEFSIDVTKKASFKIIQAATKRHFFAILDRGVADESFMLGVAAGLFLEQEMLDQYAFTGIINQAGEVFDVSYLKEKEEICRKQGLKLISAKWIDHIRELQYWLGPDPIPIPLLEAIGSSPEEAASALIQLERTFRQNGRDEYFSLDHLENFFEIKRAELVLTALESSPRGSDNRWATQISLKLRHLASRLGQKRWILHLAGNNAVFMFGIGILVGINRPAVLYEWEGDHYFPVIDLSDGMKIRKIKYIRKKTDNFKSIEWSLDEGGEGGKKEPKKDMAVGLWLAAPNPFGDILEFVKKQTQPTLLLRIASREYQGAIPIPLEGDDEEIRWLQYVSEIYSLVNLLKERKMIDHCHFFLHSPVAISAALGMAIGQVLKGSVFAWCPKRGVYQAVFEIAELATTLSGDSGGFDGK